MLENSGHGNFLEYEAFNINIIKQPSSLTVLALVLDGGFEVEGLHQSCLMQNQCVAHAVDVDALCRHADAQL